MTAALRRAIVAVALSLGMLAPSGFAHHRSLAVAAAGDASASAYGTGRVVNRGGHPQFEVDGKPFFMFGAAFFYERLPRSSWDGAMTDLQRLGFNTLDLYVPWNWHELDDGDFDFDGHSNPRRDLREVLRLAKTHGFYLIVRPGPVIRNEWRNGGYPQWLLERPEYGMPRRDIFEGRYPSTATLQNAHSDDAAAEWMHNATHMRYAERWIARALHEFDPVADRVLAVALDDDQGAYIDNQTWPAPHLQAYLEALRGTVQSVTGPDVPTFINTYQMKVPASSHVWAMGNWYQSDAYATGEHDRSQLEFSTALLQTRPGQPLWTSEFQAGWLQQPQDVIPHGADPSNTILALGTMLQSGVRGVVDFPAQDTLAPAGYEAPFSNMYYAWDAALPYPGSRTLVDGSAVATVPGRYAPTARFGEIVRTFGAQLAATHVVYDATIAWLGSAFDPSSMTNADFGALADRMQETQHACREAGLTCRLIDLRFASDRDLLASKLLLLPRPSSGPLAGRIFDPAVTARLLRLARAGLPVASLVHRASIDGTIVSLLASEARVRPVVTNGVDATFSASNDEPETGFLTVVNYGDATARHDGVVVALGASQAARLPRFDVPARSVTVVPIGVPLRTWSRAFAADDRLEYSLCPIDSIMATASGDIEIGARGAVGPCRTALFAGHHSREVSLDAQHDLVISASGRVALATRGAATVAEDRDAAEHRPDTCSTPDPNAVGAGGAAQGGVTSELIPIVGNTLLRGCGLVASAAAVAYRADVFDDGYPCVVLQNDLVRVIVSPHAGGRAFVFEDLHTRRSAFDTVGALRDDVAIEPPLSTTDRIAKYTHQFPAGTFNRRYFSGVDSHDSRAHAVLRYSSLGLEPDGVAFDKTLTLAPHSHDLHVSEFAVFPPGTPPEQHGVSIASLEVGDPRLASTQYVLPEGTTYANGLASPAPSVPPATSNTAGLYDETTHEAIFVVSSNGLHRELQPVNAPHTLVVTADLPRSGTAQTTFRYVTAPDLASAQAELAEMRTELAREYPPAVPFAASVGEGGSANPRTWRRAGKWRNGLRDRLKSD